VAWQDRLATWLDNQVARYPALDHWLEDHLHAMGLHGPQVRHLLKVRVLPGTIVFLTALLLLIAVLVISRVRRRRARERARKRGLAGRMARPASSGSGR